MPTRFRAGDTLLRSIQTGLPATSTILIAIVGVVNAAPQRYLLGAAPQTISVDGSGVAALTLTSAQTSAWLAGRYDWIIFGVDSNGQRTELAQGEIRIDPDPAGTAPVDTRSYNRRTLDAIRQLRAGKVLDDAQSYKVGDRELVHYTHAELARLEAEFETRVRGERIRNGERVPTRNKGISYGVRR